MSTVINGCIVYRELGNPPDILINWLDERNQLWNVVDDNGKERLYIDNDQPRDADITPSLVEATIGFALFTEAGKRLAGYSRLDRALRAQEGAVLTITPEFELEDEVALSEAEEDLVSRDVTTELEARIAELEVELTKTMKQANSSVELQPDLESDQADEED
jgi:hypothetical protein